MSSPPTSLSPGPSHYHIISQNDTASSIGEHQSGQRHTASRLLIPHTLPEPGQIKTRTREPKRNSVVIDVYTQETSDAGEESQSITKH